ncbi:hypothetical protein [Occallatibacter savannae]|uniref:hypothetical protein n=1 Tax=Occallatibacter savannae TaxID=1002691 RepID=UPI000D68D7FF|nr:hypothetical protein [Occallatibacter savannae]
MTDATYASVYFSYFLFFLLAGGAVFFFVRSLRDGYLGSDSEEPKFRMMQDDEGDLPTNSRRTL